MYDVRGGLEGAGVSLSNKCNFSIAFRCANCELPALIVCGAVHSFFGSLSPGDREDFAQRFLIRLEHIISQMEVLRNFQAFRIIFNANQLISAMARAS